MKFRMLMVICGTVLLAACGGGSGDSATVPAGQVLTPGTYKLTFSAISTARLSAPISGIEVAVRLPAGLSVNTTNNGATGQITPTSITAGNALQATSLAFGNYSASTRTAYLTMATTQGDYRGGRYLNLLFSVAAGTSVTPGDISALNAIYPHYKVVGLDTVTHNSVTMTGSVKTTLGVEH